MSFSLLCYLKDSAEIVERNYNHVHARSGLPTDYDARRDYVMLKVDLFCDPNFTLGEKLGDDVDGFSAKIEVDMPAYTNPGIETGSYDCGDLNVGLVVSRKIVNHDGVLHREMTIKAPTLAQVKAAIERVRRGEITPMGRDKTLLEQAFESANFELGRQRHVVAHAQGAIEAVEGYLGGQYKELTRYAIKAELPSLNDGFYETITAAKAAIDENKHIKAGNWYRFGQFLIKIKIIALECVGFYPKEEDRPNK